jgi:UDP-2-acetamido-3-amino-2,3-dideoxy-glucuronate N-acetyltransferase
LSVGVIGTGYWGKNLLRNFYSLNSLSAICDSDIDVINSYVGIYPDIATFQDVESLLAYPVKAVAIATPAESHGRLVRMALEAGKHVFVEKPLCLDVAEAESLRDEANKRGLKLMVGHLLLYHPAFCALLDFIRNNELGKLRYIYSNRLSLGKIRREENALWSFAPHDVSMILQLANELPETVVANGGSYLTPDIADTTLTYMDFSDGLRAHIFVSWLHPYKDQRLVVVGEKGMVVFNDTLEGQDKLQLFRHNIGWEGELPVVSKAPGESIPYEEGEPLKIECLTFLKAIEDELEPPTNADEGIRVLQVLNACQKSMLNGSSVSLSKNE